MFLRFSCEGKERDEGRDGACFLQTEISDSLSDHLVGGGRQDTVGVFAGSLVLCCVATTSVFLCRLLNRPVEDWQPNLGSY